MNKRLAFLTLFIILLVGILNSQPIPFSQVTEFKSLGAWKSTVERYNILLDTGDLQVFEVPLPDKEVNVDASLPAPSAGLAFLYKGKVSYLKINSYGRVLNAQVVSAASSKKRLLLKVDWHRTNRMVSAGFDFDIEQYFAVDDSGARSIGSYIVKGETSESHQFGKLAIVQDGQANFFFFQSCTVGDGPPQSIATLAPIFTGTDSAAIDLKFAIDLKASKISRASESYIRYSLNDTKINLRSEPQVGNNVKQVLVGTEVFQILSIVPRLTTVGGYRGYWILVRLEDESEGWILSAFVRQNNG